MESNHAMLPLLFQVLFLIQGIPAPLTPGGSVTGMLKTEGGKAAVGVRVAAMAKPDSLNDIANVASFAGLAETDESGNFRIENIPPGPYYIVAGRVDLPTYYPGVTSIAGGTVVSVVSGKTISGINFSMSETSVRTEFNSFGFSYVATPIIPVQVQVENGGKLPVFGPGGFTSLRLVPTAGGVAVLSPLTSSGISLTGSEYRVTVENLPEGFAVKSLMYGTTNLLSDTLKTPAATLVSTSSTGILSFVGPIPTLATIASPSNMLSVALTSVNTPSRGSGVLVTGKLNVPETRSIFISGVPGVAYSDGTYEFRHVTQGRYSIVAPGERPTSLPLAASLVVGDQDVDGIQLQVVSVVPFGFRTPANPAPSGVHGPGTLVPLPALRGHILDGESRRPISDGTAYVIGDHWTTCPLDSEGNFEVKKLLPGTYSIELQLVGYPTIQKAVTVGEEDVSLEFIAP